MFLFYSVEKMEENVSQIFAEALHRTLDRAGDEYWQAQQAEGAAFVGLDKW
jgi:post-segregation antitoxin (ccd killing protein)